MKTVMKALIDAIHYPIGEGYVENVIIYRGLNAEEECTTEIMHSKEFMGALADCLYSLIQSIGFSEADKSISALSDKDKERILLRVNSIYNSIGEPTVELEPKPMVYVGDCLLQRMAVVNTKPHSLQYLVTTQGYEDEDGYYQEGESHWEGNIPCDAVPAGKAESKEFEDGVIRSYTYTVVLPASCRTFTVGDRVKITHLGGIEREYEVKGFQRYQLQCKIWV